MQPNAFPDLQGREMVLFFSFRCGVPRGVSVSCNVTQWRAGQSLPGLWAWLPPSRGAEDEECMARRQEGLCAGFGCKLVNRVCCADSSFGG